MKKGSVSSGSTESLESVGKGRGDSCIRRLSDKRRIQLKFALFGFGVVLTTGSHDTLLFLQSSINIEKGVGVAATTAVYITASLYGLIGAPLFLRTFGAKAALIYSYVTILIFVCANFYPSFYTMVPAGVLMGTGQAAIWSTIMVYCVHFARRYARYSGRGRNAHNAEFIGCQMFLQKTFVATGNLLSYAGFLKGEEVISSSLANGTSTMNETMANGPNLAHCGANDCQDPNVTESNISQYVPASKLAIYMMVGVVAFMVLCSIVIHSLFLENIDNSLEAQDEDENEVVKGKEEEKKEEDVASLRRDFALRNNRSETEMLNVKAQGECDESFHSEESDGEDQEIADVRVVDNRDENMFRATCRHVFQPKQLLIIPFAIFSGLYPSFVFSELTRAFASCVFGVAQVGLCGAIYNSVHALTSLTVGRIVSKYGRNKPQCAAVILTLLNFAALLIWHPTESSAWLIYCLFVTIAISESTWKITVTELHASYFPGKQDIAYPVWIFWYFLGFAIQFGWSTSICVREKIYIQIAFVCFASFCYVISELLQRRRRAESQSK